MSRIIRSFLIVMIVVFLYSHVQAQTSGSYKGPKKRIAVTKFENKVKGVYGNWELGEAFAEMLTTELMNTGQFIVLERQALDDVLGEQALGQSGIVKSETAAQTGQVLGAQIIVRGVVSEFDMKKSGGGVGVGIDRFRVGIKGDAAHVAVDIRMVDATSGQVLYSHNASGTATASGLGVGYAGSDVNINADGFNKTPLGQATREAISDCVQFIISKMDTVAIEAKVIKADGGQIYINMGSAMGVRPGDIFYGYSKGEDLIDPDTGLSLGSKDSMMGQVEVTDVQEKFSIGRVVSGSGMFKRGDILKLK